MLSAVLDPLGAGATERRCGSYKRWQRSTRKRKRERSQFATKGCDLREIRKYGKREGGCLCEAPLVGVNWAQLFLAALGL